MKKQKHHLQASAAAGTVAALIGMPDGQGDGGDGGGESGAAPAGGDGGGDAPAEGGERLGTDFEGLLLEAISQDPKKDCFFKLLRFIQKTIRVFYMSFFFYFAPFGMLLYQFYLNMQARYDRIQNLNTK